MVDDFTTWETLVPKTDNFTKENMLIKYEGGLNAHFLRKMARNSSYNWQWSDGCVLIENDLFAAGEIKTYDTARDYRDSFVYVLLDIEVGDSPLPHTMQSDQVLPTFIQLSVDVYQDIYSGADLGIKAVETGGFQIMNEHETDPYYLVGIVTELREVL